MTNNETIGQKPPGLWHPVRNPSNEVPMEMQRLLQEVNISVKNSTNVTKASDGEILRNTFSSYGSALLVVLLLFCWARLRYPRVFNLRNWVPDRQTELANNQYGFFSWFWKLYQLNDYQICDECGMDAACFVRICSMGSKLCLAGMVTAIWLMPLYRTASIWDNVDEAADEIVMLTTANVGPGSSRLLGTVFSAYCIFGFTMYTILNEFKWFVAMRHHFLMKPIARNYSIYLRNIPKSYRSNKGMKNFFEKCLPGVDVLESHICIKTTNLQSKVANRDATIQNLEHAIAEAEEFGNTPKHKLGRALVPGVSVPGLLGNGREVNSIEYYASELARLNEDISRRIEELRDIADQDLPKKTQDSDNESTKNMSDEDMDEGDSFLRFVKSTAALTAGATDLVTKAATDATKLVIAGEDGAIGSAGFIVFNKLFTTSAALQMIHHENPYEMEVLAAPDPGDILWSNVGRKHKDLHLGMLISTAATIFACLLWTIPVSFVASLSSVEGLRKEVSLIDDVLNSIPSLEPIVEVLAPQFLVILNALLPVILEYFTKFEGPISGAMVEASLFVKLAAFTLVQTFFVSALSGSIIAELSKLLENTTAIIDLLANSLPKRSTFFLQMTFVMTTTSFAVEGLRIVPIIMGSLRKCVGPNLTSRERGMTILGIRPLSDPVDFPHADFLSNMVLFFMVFFVYSCIAPLVSFVIGICFLILGALFRHQFVYIYDAKPDSGGFLWLNFIRVLTSCLLIAEFTIVGLLALKKAKIATPLMFPLIVTTVLFSFYIRQEHFRITNFLPTRLCLRKDAKNDALDFAFVREAYIQPELREKVILPGLSNDITAEYGLSGGRGGLGRQRSEDNESDQESVGTGPPGCVVAKNPWLQPRESVSPKGLSCRVTNLGSSSSCGSFLVSGSPNKDISTLSEDSSAGQSV